MAIQVLRLCVTNQRIDAVPRLIDGVPICAGLAVQRVCMSARRWSCYAVGSQRRKLANASASFKLLAPLGWVRGGKWAVGGPLPQVLPLTCAAQRANGNVSSRLLHSLAFERPQHSLPVLHIPAGVFPHSTLLGKRESLYLRQPGTIPQHPTPSSPVTIVLSSPGR